MHASSRRLGDTARGLELRGARVGHVVLAELDGLAASRKDDARVARVGGQQLELAVLALQTRDCNTSVPAYIFTPGYVM